MYTYAATEASAARRGVVLCASWLREQTLQKQFSAINLISLLADYLAINIPDSSNKINADKSVIILNSY